MLIGHLSDPHVRPRGEMYQGVVDSNLALRYAIDHLLRMDRRPDLVLVTGDLVDEGRPEEYEVARELLDAIGFPYFVIPGNHDDRENFRAAFADLGFLPSVGPLHYWIDNHPVRIVGLDSCVPGAHHGHVDAAGLQWLSRVLASDRSRPTIVKLHHPPFACGIPYMDAYRHLDAGPVAAVLERHANVELVLCGQVHRPMMLRRWANTVACACPSTATEIDLRLQTAAAPRSHAGPRGVMLHLWDPDFGMVSHLSQVGSFAGPYPFAQKSTFSVGRRTVRGSPGCTCLSAAGADSVGSGETQRYARTTRSAGSPPPFRYRANARHSNGLQRLLECHVGLEIELVQLPWVALCARKPAPQSLFIGSRVCDVRRACGRFDRQEVAHQVALDEAARAPDVIAIGRCR